jgi:hypothetical protein
MQGRNGLQLEAGIGARADVTLFTAEAEGRPYHDLTDTTD